MEPVPRPNSKPRSSIIKLLTKEEAEEFNIPIPKEKEIYLIKFGKLFEEDKVASAADALDGAENSGQKIAGIESGPDSEKVSERGKNEGDHGGRKDGNGSRDDDSAPRVSAHS